MDVLKKMNVALGYIEENLTEEIDLKILAQKACCSSYNFQRMFSFITDVTLAEYIRHRRLTRAAVELQTTDITIVDLAVKYGYESAAAFSRAFYNQHGVKPSLARCEGVTLKSYPQITFQISIKGDKPMNYRIESKQAFDIYGLEVICSTTGDENYLHPGQLWTQSLQNGQHDKLRDSADEPTFLKSDVQRPYEYCKVHGASNYRKIGENTFAYMLCSFKSSASQQNAYASAHIPAATYAIFSSGFFSWENDCCGRIINEMHKQIFTEWFPTSEYEQAEGADFEIYGWSGELGHVELWYPIVKQA